jgi:hypothetical protein
MKFRTLAIAAVAIVLPLSAAACSSDSTGNHSVSDLSTQIQKQSKIPKKTADCIAEALKKADFTKADLKNLTPNTNSAKFKAYTDAAEKCIRADLPTNPGTSAP